MSWSCSSALNMQTLNNFWLYKNLDWLACTSYFADTTGHTVGSIFTHNELLFCFRYFVMIAVLLCSLFCNVRCFVMFAVLLWSLFCCSLFCFSLFCKFAVCCSSFCIHSQHIVIFSKITKYSGPLPFSVFPRCQCVYTHQAGRTPALHQNWQSSEKNTILNEHLVSVCLSVRVGKILFHVLIKELIIL